MYMADTVVVKSDDEIEYENNLKELVRSGLKELIETKSKKGAYDSKANVVAQLCIAYNLLILGHKIDALNCSVDKIRKDVHEISWR